MKINLKSFLIITSVLLGVFSLFFLSNNTKISAQTGSGIIIETTGYSMLSPSTFIFGGYYAGNVDKKDFTTYFEYKRGDNDLGNDVEKTIEINRETNMNWGPLAIGGESGDFYINQGLEAFSTYYFRAVGHFSDNPNQNFYGDVMSFNTGVLPQGVSSYPFTVGTGGVARPYASSSCTTLKDITSGTCKGENDPICDPAKEVLINGECKIIPSTTIPPVCDLTTHTLVNGECKPKTTTVIPPVCDLTTHTLVNGECKPKTNDDSGDYITGGIVQCVNNCGFKEAIELINRVIKFITIDLVLPLAAIMFAYAGFELLTSGGSTEKKSKAKSIFLNVTIGLVVVFAAFLIVQTVLTIAGYTDVASWNKF